ncbi:MAG TPA: amidohydrolase [Bryobacteraceae bacterium]|nr:amidohydrolase [Bryobacteraceae bacterium]
MTKRRVAAVTLTLMTLLLTNAAEAQREADVILLNGRIWTVNPAQPEAEAVACGGGRILAVGSNAEIRQWSGAKTKTIDLAGRRVVPGFNDAHVHFYTGGTHLTSVQLRTARSEAEFRERIAAFAAKLEPGKWITGGDWDHESWTPARLPSRQSIDAVTPDHPVFVNRLDGHMGLANSVALKMAGIDRNTPDPAGGSIVRDDAGEPTGVLKDAAMGAVYRLMPPPSREDVLNAIRAAMRYAAENGVTSVQDMSASPEILKAYQELLASDELTVRVYGHQPLPNWQRLANAGIRAAFGGDKLRIGGLKGFSDGSLGSTTALFFEPYLDAPATSGLAADEMIPPSKMLDNISGADAAGLQIAVHAIGDKANSMVLDLFASVAQKNGARDRRFRIEHAQHLRKQDMGRFGQAGVIASMQPYHLIDDGRWAENRIGPERAKGSYAFRSLLDNGAVLAFGSDWYVAPMEPLMGIYAAATRIPLDGKKRDGWIPEEKITVAEAVRAYTMGSAYASFEEKQKGSIEPGKLADMAVLSDDILALPPARIREVRVAMTIFDGRVIHTREAGK